MARINVAAEHDLVEELSLEAKKQNKTLYAMINEAIRLYLDVAKRGRSPEDVIKVLDGFDVMESLEAVPIPKILLDSSLQLASQASKDELCRHWYEQGKIVGELLKTMAPSVEELKQLVKSYRELLPVSLLELASNQDEVTLIMTGTGYSATSSECTAQALKGLLETYGLVVDEVDVSNSFLKVSAHSAK